MQIDVDIGSSSVARGVIGLVLGYVTSLVVDLAILIEVCAFLPLVMIFLDKHPLVYWSGRDAHYGIDRTVFMVSIWYQTHEHIKGIPMYYKLYRSSQICTLPHTHRLSFIWQKDGLTLIYEARTLLRLGVSRCRTPTRHQNLLSH
jgi:hypothetical protein